MLYTASVPRLTTLRPLRPDDEAVLGQIAYQTGFLGESAVKFFPHPALFSLLWISPYFRGAGALGFLALLDGQPVGYIVGATTQRAYRRAVVATVLGRGWGALRPARALLGSLPYLARAARFSVPHGDWARYPAHLHLNLLPQARGLGLGEGLLQAYLRGLRELGVPGVQLSTTTENQAALHLYRKFGFQVLVSRVTPLWTPWLGHPATHVIMGLTLARPGAAAG